jgi:DNA polymerase-1
VELPIVIDFETFGIEARPDYPPKPVGVSIIWPGKAPKYYCWAHPYNDNNTTPDVVRGVLLDAWSSGRPLLFHHAKFDLDVAREHFGLALPPWHMVHDTLFLLFFNDPHAPSLSLKPSAERVLKMKPDERDAVADWIMANLSTEKPMGEGRVLRGRPEGYCKIPKSQTGKFIAYAPTALVGPYANGDTVRTLKLFQKLYPKLSKGEKGAYDRERQLLPILLNAEAQGIPTSHAKLAKADKVYTAAMETADNYVRKKLAAPSLSVDSDAELVEALDRKRAVTQWSYTPTGKISTAKDSLLIEHFVDRELGLVLGYRNRLATCLRTFLQSWERQSRKDGRIYTNWNQVRTSHGFKDAGARTGRLSSNPPLMNIPKNFLDRGDGYEQPKLALPPLPLMRDFLLPDKGGVWCHRDYNQQELRILAHFEDGKLLELYRDNPRTDMHILVASIMYAVTLEVVSKQPLLRTHAKTLNFGLIYGMAAKALARKLGISVYDALDLIKLHAKALPDLAELNDDIKQRGRDGKYITTWGGRRYYAEQTADGYDWSYKLLNYLIQGSAAECTKQALINYDSVRKESRFLVTVHDEINISASKKAAKQELELLRQAMEAVEFSVPMLSDAKMGPTWGQLKAA